MVESEADIILDAAAAGQAAMLVVGDVFGATTHSDMAIRAKERGIRVVVHHNASIMNAVGCCGLQLYRFGETVSIPFFTESWRPDSFYEKIKFNVSGGLHTLCLLDIKVKEPDFKAMMRGRTKFLPPRFMTVNQAIDQLLEVEERHNDNICGPKTRCIGLARVGQTTQMIYAGTMEEVKEIDFGTPLHSLILVGETHHLEDDMMKKCTEEAIALSKEKVEEEA
eukprot:TRINITY_DN639_c0_g1_i1.p1 TRINITY_DN639_c0_g1~~TRINITY_DN639_c0_g1_i1.p1  ORF type:complete len:258 (-),score=80.39 TRINITY_DN639_c0_g1_i1:201-869(-)